jgi:hypothetical protein
MVWVLGVECTGLSVVVAGFRISILHSIVFLCKCCPRLTNPSVLFKSSCPLDFLVL